MTISTTAILRQLTISQKLCKQVLIETHQTTNSASPNLLHYDCISAVHRQVLWLTRETGATCSVSREVAGEELFTIVTLLVKCDVRNVRLRPESFFQRLAIFDGINVPTLLRDVGMAHMRCFKSIRQRHATSSHGSRGNLFANKVKFKKS